MENRELSFRLAGLDDFDEIVKLSEGIYDGNDYLPCIYRSWINNGNVTVLLAHSGEKLVSLVACSVVDEGRTAVSRAARTLAEFRGQGVYKRLSQAMNEFIRRQYPGVCRERFTTLVHNYPSLTQIAQMEFLRAYVTKKAFPSRGTSATNNSILIEACTKDYLCGFIFTSPVAQQLFPDNVVVPDFFPMEPLRSNIDYLQQECDLYFAVEKHDGAFPKSVSFGVLSPSVKGMHWYVTVYTSDPILYEAHLLYQFKLACEVIDGYFVFNSCQDKCLVTHGRQVLQERPQLELNEEMSKMSMKLYENKFLQ